MILHGSLACKETDAGLSVWYEKGEIDKTIVSQEIMRYESFSAAFPAIIENWGLVKIGESAFWPGDSVYEVGKPDAEMITIARC